MILSSVVACSFLFVSAEPPNVIFIMADDLGYGDLGCYGQDQILTPNIDRLAREGTRFTDAYAGSTVCAPSRCVLMTGKHTGHVFIRGNRRLPLPLEEWTVAEALSDEGYATALVGKWGLGREGTTGEPTAQGFDRYFGYLDQGHAHNYYPTFLIRDGECVSLPNVVPKEWPSGAGHASEKRAYSHDLFIADALEFIDDNRDQPFFLYLPLTIPHANNEAGKEGMEVPELGPYAEKDWPAPQLGTAAMITRMDSGVGEILDRLEAHGIARNTIVVFTSDNGPHREGGNNPDFFDSNGALKGIKRSLHDGGIRVPMIVRWPGHVPAGAVSDAVWSFADVLPTLAEACGAESPGEIDGVSVLASWKGEDQPSIDERFLYWEFHGGGFFQAARKGKWKAVRNTGKGQGVQLYDLDADLGETNDLSEQHPEITAMFATYLGTARTPSEHWRTPSERSD